MVHTWVGSSPRLSKGMYSTYLAPAQRKISTSNRIQDVSEDWLGLSAEKTARTLMLFTHRRLTTPGTIF